MRTVIGLDQGQEGFEASSQRRKPFVMRLSVESEHSFGDCFGILSPRKALNPSTDALICASTMQVLTPSGPICEPLQK